MRNTRRALWIVNSVSLSRVVGSSIFLILALDPDTIARRASLIFLLLLMFSDLVDGFLARRFQVTTVAGYVLDGLGDRAMYLAILLVLNHYGAAGVMATFLVVMRDLFLYGMRALWSDWRQTIASGRGESKLNALLLRVVLALPLFLIFAPDFDITISESSPLRPLATSALYMFILFSYALLFRSAGRLLRTQSENQADDDREKRGQPF